MDHATWHWVLGVIFITCNLHTAFAQEPQITESILPEIKRVGETGRLNCSVTRQGENKVYWAHKERLLTITSDDKIYVDESQNLVVNGKRKFEVKKYVIGERITYQLIINTLQRDDAGTYTCSINVQGSSPAELPAKDGQMIVLMPPVIIQSTTTQSQAVVEFADIHLSCFAQGYPQPNVSWVRGNGMNLPYPVNAFASQAGNMTLRGLKSVDRGVYRCLADNNVKPTASLDITLYIEFRPSARVVQSSYGQAQNRMFDITIECIISGYPDPDLQWKKKDKQGWELVTDDEKHNIHIIISHGAMLSVSDFWFQLTIINVQANDYTIYACEGANNHGTSSAFIQVYETSECQGANCPPDGPVAAGPTHRQAAWTTLLLTTAIFMLLH